MLCGHLHVTRGWILSPATEQAAVSRVRVEFLQRTTSQQVFLVSVSAVTHFPNW